CWPLSLEKLDNGKNLKIIFDDNVEFIICSELLRVESPSAEVQGHSGPKKIIRNKKDITIKKIEQIGNYAIRLIFSDDHSSGIYSWELLYNYGKNQKILLEQYYNSL
ncbi:MAG: gamma-butyrobetaine hydroxylase-like domain-containing protein, partial [Candidatus Puniceispirillales bacterium]